MSTYESGFAGLCYEEQNKIATHSGVEHRLGHWTGVEFILLFLYHIALSSGLVVASFSLQIKPYGHCGFLWWHRLHTKVCLCKDLLVHWLCLELVAVKISVVSDVEFVANFCTNLARCDKHLTYFRISSSSFSSSSAWLTTVTGRSRFLVSKYGVLGTVRAGLDFLGGLGPRKLWVYKI